MPIPEQLRPALRSVVNELAAGHFSILEQDGRAGRVGAIGLEGATKQYGRKLIDLPEEAFETASALSIKGRSGEWAIDLDLWTVEEGRSDLTLSVTVRESNGDVKVEIDDLHVL